MEEKIKKFIQYINESNRIVFFGGAGVSTESGIPDFRSKDGLYNQHDVNFEKYHPEYLLSHDCLVNEPDVFYEFYRQKMDVRGIEPNVTHQFLAKLEDSGKLSAIVTQNIDGLHQLAGSRKVYELHGTTQRNYCMRCKKEYSKDILFQGIHTCAECGGQIRPDVVLYGENLPDRACVEATKKIKEADMLIIAGTSLRVYPAANFIYHFAGKHMVVINREPLSLELNENSDLVFTCSMGEVFGAIRDCP